MFTAIPSFCDKVMHRWNVLLLKPCFSHVHDLLNVAICDYVMHTLVFDQIFPQAYVCFLPLLKPVQQQKHSLTLGHKQPFDDSWVWGQRV